MQKTFPLIEASQELLNEVAAAGRMLDMMLPPGAHHQLAFSAWHTKFFDGTELVNSFWTCTVLDGQSIGAGREFVESANAPDPMSAVEAVMSRWRKWFNDKEAKRVAAKREQFDAENVPDRFDNAA